jgi:hypothetical protein
MFNDKFGFVKRLMREALGLPVADPLPQNGQSHPVKPAASWSGTFTPLALGATFSGGHGDARGFLKKRKCAILALVLFGTVYI